MSPAPTAAVSEAEVVGRLRYAAARAWLAANSGSNVMPPTDYITGWFASHYGKALDAALAAAAARPDDVQALRERVERLTKENDVLRASVANGTGPCVYCSLPRARWSECQHGFPGCARGDDAMLCPHVGAELETAAKLDDARANLALANEELFFLRAGAEDDRAQVSELKSKLAEAREVLRPFSSILKGNLHYQRDEMRLTFGPNDFDLRFCCTVGDLRRAAAIFADPIAAPPAIIPNDNASARDCTDAPVRDDPIAEAERRGALQHEAAFLLDRLSELEDSTFTEDGWRDFYGHVSPSISRLARIIRALPTTPEDRPLGAISPEPEIRS